MAEEMTSARCSSRERDAGESHEKKRERTREKTRERSRSRSRERKKSKKSKKEKKSKKDAKKKHRKKDKSSSSRSSRDKKRKRRRRDEDDGEKNSDDSSSSSSSESGSDREDAPRVDRERAAAVVRTLLGEFPAIAPDLLALLQMLDDGETALISGIANARVKTLLATLFPLLGLKKLRKPDDAYIASKSSKDSLLETVAEMLASDGSNQEGEPQPERQDVVEQTEAEVASETTPSAVERRRHEAPIGPTLPPASSASVTTSYIAEDDNDDDYIGPALPGMKGFRFADERVEAEMARRAKQLEEDEWRRARGEAPLGSGQAPAAGGREAWMTQMPVNNKIFQDAMGGAMQRTSGKPAAFRSKEPAAIDSTWFDAPEERERAKRAKLDIELLGYVRPENAAAPKSSDAIRPPMGGPSVNESILPAANPEADQDMRRQMDAMHKKRGPSLLEQHQQKVAAEQKSQAAGDAEKLTWDRDRDLTARRGLSQSDADRIITASKEISSKFTAPTVTRQFL